MFLLPVLERAGFGKWAAEPGVGEPEPDVLAAQIFHLLLSRLRVDEEDPAWTLAAAFRLKPEATQSPSRDLRGFRLQAEGCEVANIWLTTCRRHLRRHARIGLASLVLRPARLAITPTHVDVFFRLNAADVRIRRAGLDVDPGWVPWFRRVVAFHYGDRPWN
jgi:hypothetical protein